MTTKVEKMATDCNCEPCQARAHALKVVDKRLADMRRFEMMKGLIDVKHHLGHAFLRTTQFAESLSGRECAAAVFCVTSMEAQQLHYERGNGGLARDLPNLVSLAMREVGLTVDEIKRGGAFAIDEFRAMEW